MRHEPEINEFIGRHAATLQSLRFEDCWVGRHDILQLRSLNLRQLVLLEITWNDIQGDKCRREVEEKRGLLLAYLNHTAAVFGTEYGDISVARYCDGSFLTKIENNEKNVKEEDNKRVLPDWERKKWTFTHRDGRTAIGDEPLEYFSDWDSDDSDDVADSYYSEEESVYDSYWSDSSRDN